MEGGGDKVREEENTVREKRNEVKGYKMRSRLKGVSRREQGERGRKSILKDLQS